MSEGVHTAERLKQLQKLPLWRKIQISQTRIIEFVQWCEKNNLEPVIMYSGGGR